MGIVGVVGVGGVVVVGQQKWWKENNPPTVPLVLFPLTSIGYARNKTIPKTFNPQTRSSATVVESTEIRTVAGVGKKGGGGFGGGLCSCGGSGSGCSIFILGMFGAHMMVLECWFVTVQSSSLGFKR